MEHVICRTTNNAQTRDNKKEALLFRLISNIGPSPTLLFVQFVIGLFVNQTSLVFVDSQIPFLSILLCGNCLSKLFMHPWAFLPTKLV